MVVTEDSDAAEAKAAEDAEEPIEDVVVLVSHRDLNIRLCQKFLTEGRKLLYFFSH